MYFKLINIESTVGNGKKRCLAMIQEAIKQEEERKKPQSMSVGVGAFHAKRFLSRAEFGGRSNEVRQVWNEKDIAVRPFALRILSGQLIPAGEFDEVRALASTHSCRTRDFR